METCCYWRITFRVHFTLCQAASQNSVTDSFSLTAYPQDYYSLLSRRCWIMDACWQEHDSLQLTPASASHRQRRGCGYICIATILSSAHPSTSPSNTRLVMCGCTWPALNRSHFSSCGIVEQTNPASLPTWTFHLNAIRGHTPLISKDTSSFSFPFPTI